MLRLSLNVASTRADPQSGAHRDPGAAGDVIEGFSRFIIAGNFVIGMVIFAILVIINFVVITKGSTRIAEVAARFSLDAMPGKQMAIDADMGAGLIDEDEARRRRKELEDESAFFGAMDGASKFVRGDAVAGLIITLINVIGGILIGVVQRGMSSRGCGQRLYLADHRRRTCQPDPGPRRLARRRSDRHQGRHARVRPTKAVMQPAVELPQGALHGVASALRDRSAAGLSACSSSPSLPRLMSGLGYFIQSNAAKAADRRPRPTPSRNRRRRRRGVRRQTRCGSTICGSSLGEGLVPLAIGPMRRCPARSRALRNLFAEEFRISPCRRSGSRTTPACRSTAMRSFRCRASMPPAAMSAQPDDGDRPRRHPAVDCPESAPRSRPSASMRSGSTLPWRSEAEDRGLTVVDPESVITTHLTEVIKEHMAGAADLQLPPRRLIDGLDRDYQKLVSDITRPLARRSCCSRFCRNCCWSGCRSGTCR